MSEEHAQLYLSVTLTNGTESDCTHRPDRFLGLGYCGITGQGDRQHEAISDESGSDGLQKCLDLAIAAQGSYPQDHEG
jgi:hypothetical protein